MSSQFIYLKSSKYLKDNDGGSILVNNSELPYQFINSFREPIRVNPKSQIEIVSADLNVEPLHDISSINDNDAFTYAAGIVAEEFRQKLVKIPNGIYSNDQLAQKIDNIVNETNNVDGFDIKVSYDVIDGFNVEFFTQNFGETEDKNEWTLLSQKQGFEQTDAEKNTGIGTYGAEIYIRERNYLKYPNVDVRNNIIPTLTSATLTNTTKPTNLCSNVLVPTLRGIDASNGTTSMILKPIQHLIFPDGFETPTAGKTFTSVIGSTTTTGITIDAEGGGHNLSFKFTAGATTYHCKFIRTRADWDTITLPNSISNGNLPFGHFIIINTSNQNINTTLSSNFATLLLDTSINANNYKWRLFDAGTSGLSTFDFFLTANPIDVKSMATLTSLGNWGSSVFGLSRGECAIVGTNQVDNVNRYTRARINNNDGDTQNDVRKRVLMDYAVLISPNKNGDDNIVKVVYGTQDGSKVAGEVDWIDNTTRRTFFLKSEFPDITDDDNIVITASMNAWYCLDFLIGHDTAGNGVFNNVSVVSSTLASSTNNLPMNFNEDSFPIMPVLSPSNGYVANNQSALIFGDYSNKLISTHSLAKLNAYMNATWGSNQGIPPRQSKALYTNYCRDYNLVDREKVIQFNGWGNIDTNQTYNIPDGDVELGQEIEVNSLMMKLGMPLDDVDTSRINASGFSPQPPVVNEPIADRTPFISRLNLHMGMPSVLLVSNEEDDNDPNDIPDMRFESDNEIIYNESQNFIVNLSNLGKITGQNSNTNSVSAIAGIIPSAQLTDFGNSKHFKAAYPQPVSINAKTEELINNFEVNISNDDGTPATSLRHPINLTCRLTEN